MKWIGDEKNVEKIKGFLKKRFLSLGRYLVGQKDLLKAIFQAVFSDLTTKDRYFYRKDKKGLGEMMLGITA